MQHGPVRDGEAPRLQYRLLGLRPGVSIGVPERNAGSGGVVGAGGVGKAVAFALAELGAKQVSLFDSDREKGARLAAAIRGSAPEMETFVAASVEQAVAGADGLVNCTPLGMTGMPGTAVSRRLMGDARWAFDAVYTPVDTEFLSDARASGLETISGYELFFHQGTAAFEVFTGRQVEAAALREALQSRVGANV